MYVNRGKNHFFPIQPVYARLGQKIRKVAHNQAHRRLGRVEIGRKSQSGHSQPVLKKLVSLKPALVLARLAMCLRIVRYTPLCYKGGYHVDVGCAGSDLDLPCH